MIRMDQPYSRVADALLDKQYWAPDDPQKTPYDDTGWSFTQLFNIKVVRVTNPALLAAEMTSFNPAQPEGSRVSGTGNVVAISNTGQSSLLALLYKLKDAHIEITDKAFDLQGKHFGPGSLLLSDVPDPLLSSTLSELALDGVRLSARPSVATHAATPPKIAFMHSWQGTQTEGWWRYAFDNAQIPFDYMSTHALAGERNLRVKYDVIIFAPIGHATMQSIVDGMPKYGNALPWQQTELTPNLGKLDSTPDMRIGLGYDGLQHLREFVEKGGLLITCEDTAQFAIDAGLAPGVSVQAHGEGRVVGAVLNTVFVSTNHPVAWGFGTSVPVMSADGLAFNVSNTLGRTGGRVLMDPYAERPTGRGSVEDADIPQGRKITEPDPLLKQQPWEPKALNEEQVRNNPYVIPANMRPEVILRFAATKDLLLSGLLDKAGSIAEHAIVVDAHLGKGNVLLFANNPVYRGETIGSYPLVFNAIMNFQHLDRTEVAGK